MHTTWDGQSLHQSLLDDMRRARKRGPAPGIVFLPGAVFTDGTHMYEVVYGCQGLGPDSGGWVAGIRTDYIDSDDEQPKGYQLFSWQGRAVDGVLVLGGRTSAILRLVAPAPRLSHG